MFNKKDLVVSLIIGEISAWLLVVLAKGFAPLELRVKYSEAIFFGLPIFFPIGCALLLYVAHIVSKKITVVYQLAKFTLIGGFNTLVDWGILALLIFIFRQYFEIEPKDAWLIILSLIIVYYSLFKAFSFIVATISSYFWNKFWTFNRAATEKVGKEVSQFLVISICGFLINVGIASAIFKFIKPVAGLNIDQWGIISAILATTISMVWNFLGYRFIVFSAKKIAPQADMAVERERPPARKII